MDLTTRYMGLSLKNPLVASASPLSQQLDGIRRLEDGGAAAVVLFSLFEEQIRHDTAALEYFVGRGTDSYAEALSYFPDIRDYDVGPGQYLELIRRATEAVEIPVIASLNGISETGWVNFAQDMADAGARGIELNIYYIPTDLGRTGSVVEQQYVDILRAVKTAVTIPVAMKVGPYFSSFANMARRLDEAGANALVLFNRFYQPDFDIENRVVVPSLALSTADRDPRAASLAVAAAWPDRGVAGGDHRGPQRRRGDQYLMAGADVVMSTSAVLQQGTGFFATTLADMTAWMERKGYVSVEQLRGSMSQEAMPDTAHFVRNNYLKVLESYTQTTINDGRRQILKLS